jgi:hypothetical protein
MLCRGAYAQVAQLLQQEYPGISVVGSTYPPTTLRMLASRVLGGVQMGLLASVFMGDKIFEMLGYAQPPAWFTQNVASNKVGAPPADSW